MVFTLRHNEMTNNPISVRDKVPTIYFRDFLKFLSFLNKYIAKKCTNKAITINREANINQCKFKFLNEFVGAKVLQFSVPFNEIVLMLSIFVNCKST